MFKCAACGQVDGDTWSPSQMSPLTSPGDERNNGLSSFSWMGSRLQKTRPCRLFFASGDSNSQTYPRFPGPIYAAGLIRHPISFVFLTVCAYRLKRHQHACPHQLHYKTSNCVSWLPRPVLHYVSRVDEVLDLLGMGRIFLFRDRFTSFC